MGEKDRELTLDDVFTSVGTYDREEYEPSYATQYYKDMIEAVKKQKPTYTSQWQTQIKDILGQINNREKFSYDLNGDALYQQYKDKYTQQGKLAMQDTMGQAAALTGGYGNSYAAAVGNQAYQGQLNNLNDIVPELYQMAYDMYNQDTQNLYKQYSLYTDQENSDYAKYTDKLNAWRNELDYYTDRYNAERDYDYGMYSDEENAKQTQFNADRNVGISTWNDYLEATNPKPVEPMSINDIIKVEEMAKKYDDEDELLEFLWDRVSEGLNESDANRIYSNWKKRLE